MLKEYQDVFAKEFRDMKGIIEELGVMRIPLKPEAQPVKKRPYRLNLKYKERMKQQLDQLLQQGLIEPIDEAEWASPLVIQPKKQKNEIRVCVDYRELNKATITDPFPTPYAEDIL